MKRQAKQLLVLCAATALSAGAGTMTYGAVGWVQEGGDWRYYTAAGDAVTEDWKKSGDHWFWLDEDGAIARDTLIEDGEHYYYVNGDGAMVKNEWRHLDVEDADDGEPDTAWYYFGANGRAFQAPDSGKTTFKTIKCADGVSRKYAFDGEGRMLCGWVNESSERMTEDDGCEVYYFGDSPKEGVMATGKATLEVDGEKYTYGFGKSGDERGQGLCGISDGSIYRKGRLMKADRDARLEEVSFEGNRYLVNTSGKIQKNKKNVRDADDMYYCTDAEGIVTYKGSEKWTDDEK